MSEIDWAVGLTRHRIHDLRDASVEIDMSKLDCDLLHDSVKLENGESGDPGWIELPRTRVLHNQFKFTSYNI